MHTTQYVHAHIHTYLTHPSTHAHAHMHIHMPTHTLNARTWHTPTAPSYMTTAEPARHITPPTHTHTSMSTDGFPLSCAVRQTASECRVKIDNQRSTRSNHRTLSVLRRLLDNVNVRQSNVNVAVWTSRARRSAEKRCSPLVDKSTFASRAS